MSTSLQIIQGFIALLIAGAVAGIGYRQWRTAQERAVLDLFEKRWEAYTALRVIIGETAREGRCSNEQQFAFLRATERAEYLFGDDVTSYLRSIYHLMIDLDLANTMMQANNSEANWVEKRHDAFKKIAAFYKEAPTLLKPYMHMTHRMPMPLLTRLKQMVAKR